MDEWMDGVSQCCAVQTCTKLASHSARVGVYTKARNENARSSDHSVDEIGSHAPNASSQSVSYPSACVCVLGVGVCVVEPADKYKIKFIRCTRRW